MRRSALPTASSRSTSSTRPHGHDAGLNALLQDRREPPGACGFVFAPRSPERSSGPSVPAPIVPARFPGPAATTSVRGESGEPSTGVLSFVERAGGVRADSLSVLDQLIAPGQMRGTGPMTETSALLGFTDGELLDATITAFAGMPGRCFRRIDHVIENRASTCGGSSGPARAVPGDLIVLSAILMPGRRCRARPAGGSDRADAGAVSSFRSGGAVPQNPPT